MDSTLYEFKNMGGNGARPVSKKGPPVQRPLSAQGPKLGGNRFAGQPLQQKQNYYVEEEEGSAEQNANFPGTGKNRPNTGMTKQIYSNNELRRQENESNEDEMQFVPKEISSENFPFQDMQRLIPKTTPLEKEKLYEENIQLKNMINKLKDENLKTKTKNVALERETTKLMRMVEKASSSHMIPGVQTGNQESSLLMNLKRQNKELRDEVKIKSDEIESFKRNTKTTKFQEIESELKAFIDENIRLKGLLEEQIRANPQIKVEDYNALEEKYYMQTNLLESIQKDLAQYKQIIKYLEEENNAIKSEKDKEDKQKKSNVTELTRLKKQVKEKDQEIHKLVTYYKYDANSFKTKYGSPVEGENKPGNNKLPSNTQQDDDEDMKKAIAHKNKQIDHLEKTVNDLKSKNPNGRATSATGNKRDSETHKEKQKEPDTKYNAAVHHQEVKERKSSPIKEDIGGDHYIPNPKPQRGQSANGRDKDASLDNSKVKKDKRIAIDDVRHIGYELTLVLRLRQIPYEELESKLFDDKNSKTAVSVEDLKMILLSDPFELTDTNNAALAARFLFEYGDDKFDGHDARRTKELGLLKSNFRKLIGKYSLITEEIEKDLFDYISQTIAKYEESIKTHFISIPGAKDELISYIQLQEGFKNMEIELDNQQMDYLILRLYDLSHSLQELEYTKMFEIFQTEENIRLKQIFDLYNENLNDLHQIRETDSDDREKMRSTKLQSTSEKKKPKPAQVEEDEYGDDYDFEEQQPAAKIRPRDQEEEDENPGEDIEVENMDGYMSDIH
jgi:hypothetical protein